MINELYLSEIWVNNISLHNKQIWNHHVHKQCTFQISIFSRFWVNFLKGKRNPIFDCIKGGQSMNEFDNKWGFVELSLNQPRTISPIDWIILMYPLYCPQMKSTLAPHISLQSLGQGLIVKSLEWTEINCNVLISCCCCANEGHKPAPRWLGRSSSNTGLYHVCSAEALDLLILGSTKKRPRFKGDK